MFNLILFYELAVSMLRFDSYGMGYMMLLWSHEALPLNPQQWNLIIHQAPSSYG